MSEIPEDVLAYATEIVAGELRKVPWINAPPDRIRAVAQAAVGQHCTPQHRPSGKRTWPRSPGSAGSSRTGNGRTSSCGPG